MSNLFFDFPAGWFTVPAIVGTLFFSLRMALMFIGGADADLDADVGLDVDVGADVDFHAADSSDAFKLLSIQSIAAFLMGFGWGGLGALRGAGWSIVMSGAFGVAAGVGMVWLLGKLLSLIYRLQSSGNVSIQQALYMDGTVYTAIPAEGSGRGMVRVVIDERERFYKAVTNGGGLASSERVRVLEVNDDNSVTVERV